MLQRRSLSRADAAVRSSESRSLASLGMTRRGEGPGMTTRARTREDGKGLEDLARSAAGGLLDARGRRLCRGGGGGKKDFLHCGEPARRLLEAAASPVTDEDVPA